MVWHGTWSHTAQTTKPAGSELTLWQAILQSDADRAQELLPKHPTSQSKLQTSRSAALKTNTVLHSKPTEDKAVYPRNKVNCAYLRANCYVWDDAVERRGEMSARCAARGRDRQGQPGSSEGLRREPSLTLNLKGATIVLQRPSLPAGPQAPPLDGA